MRTSLQNLILTCFSILVAIGIGELVIRVGFPQAQTGADVTRADPLNRLLEFDPVLQSRYRPGVSAVVRSQYGEFAINYQTNELGLRDRPLAADSNSRRLLALGNSFVEGWGVEADASFVRIAEAKLNADRTVVRFVNAGMSGYGAAQTYLLGRDLIAKSAPAGVVFFYASTMVQADRNYLALADVDGSGLATGLNPDLFMKDSPQNDAVPAPMWRGWIAALARYSALARMADSGLAAAEARAKIKPGDPASDLLAGVRGTPERLHELHSQSLKHVAALAAVAREKRLPFLLVHLPMPHQLSAEAWPLGRLAYGLENKVYAADDVEVVRQFCKQHDMRCLWAHEALRAAEQAQPAGTSLYYRYDFHPNPAGNRVIGEWLAAQIRPWLGEVKIADAEN